MWSHTSSIKTGLYHAKLPKKTPFLFDFFNKRSGKIISTFKLLSRGSIHNIEVFLVLYELSFRPRPFRYETFDSRLEFRVYIAMSVYELCAAAGLLTGDDVFNF